MTDPAPTQGDQQKTTDGAGQAPQQLPARRPPDPAVLSGAQKYADGDLHIGVAIMVTSDGNPSTLMIPDVTKVKPQQGMGAPVYITKPIRIDGKNLKAFLKEKKITLPEAIGGNDKDEKDAGFNPGLIANLMISCEAFYYMQDGPLLMMFALTTQKVGLIESLTGDAALGKLFDIQGASVRIMRCPASSFSVLQDYVAELTA
jgi:hypothetical protein